MVRFTINTEMKLALGLGLGLKRLGLGLGLIWKGYERNVNRSAVYDRIA